MLTEKKPEHHEICGTITSVPSCNRDLSFMLSKSTVKDVPSASNAGDFDSQLQLQV